MLYPNKIKKDFVKTIEYGNRGMDLEHLINVSNKYYEINDIAIIYKKPTPITINKYDKENNVIKGEFKSKSTLDYVGLYKGRYLDFDAKCTKNKTSFPLSNIHSHQIEHIKRIIKHDGIAFLIIEMDNRIFLLKGEDLISFISNEERKSIPLSYLEENAFIIKLLYNPVLDYLKEVEKIYFKKVPYGQEN